jgi:hypothetical protein
MKSEMKRLCKMTSLRQLRSVQRENEVARVAAIGRVKSASLKVLSLSDVVMLLVKRYAPIKVKYFVETIFGFTE